MTLSKFDELKNLALEDYKNSYKHSEEIFIFIRLIIKKIFDYLGCTHTHNILIIDSEKHLLPIDSYINDAFIIQPQGFYLFNLLVKLVDEPFNSNNSGQSFSKNGLLPISGVVLPIAVKRIDTNEYKIVLHQVSDQKQTKIFDIYMDNEDSYLTFLESCFDLMKEILEKEGSLDKRIEKLNIEYNYKDHLAFGFH